MAVERVEFGSCSCFQTNSSFQRHSVPVVAVVEVDRMHQRQMRVDFVVVGVVVVVGHGVFVLDPYVAAVWGMRRSERGDAGARGGVCGGGDGGVVGVVERGEAVGRLRSRRVLKERL